MKRKNFYFINLNKIIFEKFDLTVKVNITKFYKIAVFSWGTIFHDTQEKKRQYLQLLK